MIGTAAYLAPEQVRGQHVGTAADTYALGQVLLECLTGRPEYPGGATEAALARLHRAPVVPDRLPLPLRRMLSEMTAKDPAERPSAGHVAAVLATPSTVAADPTARLALLQVNNREPRGQASNEVDARSLPNRPARTFAQGSVLGGFTAALLAGLVTVVVGVGSFEDDAGAGGTTPPTRTSAPPSPKAEPSTRAGQGPPPVTAPSDETQATRGHATSERRQAQRLTERDTVFVEPQTDPEPTAEPEPTEEPDGETTTTTGPGG